LQDSDYQIPRLATLRAVWSGSVTWFTLFYQPTAATFMAQLPENTGIARIPGWLAERLMSSIPLTVILRPDAWTNWGNLTIDQVSLERLLWLVRLASQRE
jgi:hypothetical protein